MSATSQVFAPGKAALVLSGGGARGAYQAGVVRGLLAITGRYSRLNPFPVLTGVSAGAVNAAYLAAHANHVHHAAQRLVDFWGSLHTEHVFRKDPLSLGQIGVHWALEMLSGGLSPGARTHALFDTSPLSDLVAAQIPFNRIQDYIAAGDLEALAVSATDYATSESITFYMSGAEVRPWRRSRRHGRQHEISRDHVLASAAIPLLFPPVPVAGRYYGDGCLRNTAPLSPALHLGADRLVIVGVRHAVPVGSEEAAATAELDEAPPLARILSVIINAVLLDAVDADLERLERINRTVEVLPSAARPLSALRPVAWLYLQPSLDIAAIAAEEAATMPAVIRYLLGGLGSIEQAADMISYLLFEPAFCQRLLALGYRDALARRDEIEDFMFAGGTGSRLQVSQERLSTGNEVGVGAS